MSYSSSDDKPPIKTRSWLERLSALLNREPKDKQQLMEILRDAEERDLFSSEMLSMIERILQVSEMQVREVMVPKSQMVVVNKNLPFEKCLPIVIESGHSRFPVIDHQAKKEVLGMLLAKDLLKYCFNEIAIRNFNIESIMRPAVFTPQSKRLDVLLREFRVNRNHIAIVLDEYGHVVGLVTIEDVLEQIVGEIEDEYDMDEDEEESYIKRLDDGTYIVKAATPLDEFNESFHADLKGPSDCTIGEWVSDYFEHQPKRGETVKIDCFRFKVLQGDSQDIHLFEVKVLKSKKKK